MHEYQLSEYTVIQVKYKMSTYSMLWSNHTQTIYSYAEIHQKNYFLKLSYIIWYNLYFLKIKLNLMMEMKRHHL